MSRSSFGGRHELGQNFLTHKPTLARLCDLVRHTHGPILEIGAGDGALTRRLATLERPLVAIDIDEHRVRSLRRKLPDVQVEHADAMTYPLTAPVVVGNIPFHLTTPLLRRILGSDDWQRTILLTQWEVARKRAGLGGSTMMTAQSAPWFRFILQGRVPAWAFSPQPSVDGGILEIIRRGPPLIPTDQKKAYEQFVKAVFTGRGRNLPQIVRHAGPNNPGRAKSALKVAHVPHGALPRDLTVDQWCALWRVLTA